MKAATSKAWRKKKKEAAKEQAEAAKEQAEAVAIAAKEAEERTKAAEDRARVAELRREAIQDSAEWLAAAVRANMPAPPTVVRRIRRDRVP